MKLNKIRTVVIDDEVSNRSLITKLVSKLNKRYDVIGEAADVNEAYTLINNLKPDLVLLDIKMPSGSGFDLLLKFENITFEVVFISGFDTYALKAFEFNALDYILKPIDPIKFSKTLDKILLRLGQASSNSHLTSALKSYDAEKRTIAKILLHNGNMVVLVNISDVIHIQSEDRCVYFKLKSNERYSSSKELSDFSFILESYAYMVKVSKNTYVNLNYVSAYSKGSTCVLTMSDKSSIEIPRRKKNEILELLKNTGILNVS